MPTYANLISTSHHSLFNFEICNFTSKEQENTELCMPKNTRFGGYKTSHSYIWSEHQEPLRQLKPALGRHLATYEKILPGVECTGFYWLQPDQARQFRMLVQEHTGLLSQKRSVSRHCNRIWCTWEGLRFHLNHVTPTDVQKKLLPASTILGGCGVEMELGVSAAVRYHKGMTATTR